MVNIRHEMELFQCRVDVNPQPRSPPFHSTIKHVMSGVNHQGCQWFTRLVVAAAIVEAEPRP